MGKEKAEEAVRICEESSAQNKLTEEVFVAVTELEPKLPVSEHVFDQQDPVPFVLSSLAPGAKAGATHASRWSDLRSKTWPASIVNSSRHWTPKMDQMACECELPDIRTVLLLKANTSKQSTIRKRRESWPTHILGLVLPVVGPEDGPQLLELEAVKEKCRIAHRNVVRIEHQHLVEPFRRFDQRGAFQVKGLGPPASCFVE